jgi:hypothetical protein
MFGPQVRAGRYTAELPDDGVVVFLIGMRFNHWWRVDKWWFSFNSMIKILRYLSKGDDGLLQSRYWFGHTLLLVQYWRGIDDLMAFATDPKAPHADTWREFNRRIGNDGSVGIYHETYQIVPGNSEAMYVNMPLFGLGAATGHVAVDKTRDRARQRMANQRRARPLRRHEDDTFRSRSDRATSAPR